MSNYADRQAERDADYARAYREWVASLPPAERAALAAGGLSDPDTARHTSSFQPESSALEREAAPEPRPDTLAEQIDETPPPIPASETAATAAADVLASFCARIRAHTRPLLAFDAACFASGLMDVEGLSETALARRHGVTRAGFSKLVIQWCDLFGLRPSRGMRTKRARRAYRDARLTSLAQRKAPAAPLTPPNPVSAAVSPSHDRSCLAPSSINPPRPPKA